MVKVSKRVLIGWIALPLFLVRKVPQVQKLESTPLRYGPFVVTRIVLRPQVVTVEMVL